MSSRIKADIISTVGGPDIQVNQLAKISDIHDIVTSSTESVTVVEGQTAITFQTLRYTPNSGNLHVYVNGLRETQFVEPSTSSIVMLNSLAAGDIVTATASLVRELTPGVASGIVGLAKETQTASPGQTQFDLATITYTPGAKNLSVFVNGVYKSPALYTENNSTRITFSSGMTGGEVVDFSVVQLSVVNGTSRRFRYVATAGQTSFSGSDYNGKTMSYDVGFVDVYLNGIRLDQTDFTASTGTSIVLAVSASTSDEINVVAYGNFQLSNINSQDVKFTQTGTGAVERDVRAKLKDTVSVLDFGADPTGVSDSTAAFNLAVSNCQISGKSLTIPSGTYNYTGNLYSLPITMIGVDRPKIILTGRFQFQTDNNILGNSTLSAGSSVGTQSVTVSSATNFAAGQLLVVYDPTVMDSAYNRGSYTTALITSVVGTTINLKDPLVYPLFSGATVTSRAAASANVSGIDFYMPNVPGSNLYCLVYSGLVNPTISDCRFFETSAQKVTLNNAVYVQQCYGLEVNKFYSNGPLYGISIIGGRQFNIRGATMYNGRHPVVPSFGASNIEVDGVTTHNCACALDGHVAFNISYRNVREYNSSEWFALRALGVTIQNMQSEHIVALSGSPQLHDNFLTPSYSSLNQSFDLEIDDFRIQGPSTANLDIVAGKNIRLQNCYWPGITLSVSGGTALNASSAKIDSNCVFAAQGNTRIYVSSVNGNQQKLDAVLNSSVYEIQTPKSFIDTVGYSAKCRGLLYPSASTTNGSIISCKIYDDFGYGPAGYLRYVSGSLVIIVKDITGSRRLKYGFAHTIVSTSAIAFDVTPITNEAFPASANPSTVTISNISHAGVTQVGASRFGHFVGFDVTFSLPSTPRTIELQYELELNAMT